MKNLLYLSGIVLILFLVGCSKNDVQLNPLDTNEDVSLKKANKYVPFNASFDISVDLNSVVSDPAPLIYPPPYPPTYPPFTKIPFKKYQEVYGDGTATHLGNTDVKLNQWWRPNPLPWPPKEGEPFQVWSGIGCGEIYFTAANGDLLLAEYDGAIAVHLTPDYVETTLTGNFKDGGTGRFAHAEGWFLWEVEYFTPPTNFGIVTVSGEIMYSK